MVGLRKAQEPYQAGVGMSVVVSIGDFRRKETVAVLRELLVKAARGEVAGFAFEVEFRDGSHKSGFTGKYRSDAMDAAKAALRMSQHLNAIQDMQEAAAVRNAL